MDPVQPEPERHREDFSPQYVPSLPDPAEPSIGSPGKTILDARRVDDSGRAASPPGGGGGWGLKAAALAGAIVLGYFLMSGGRGGAIDETASANWKGHVAELKAKHEAGQDVVKWVNRGGVAVFGTEVALSEADRDQATSDGVRAALQAHDTAKANATLQAAQAIPPPAPGLKDKQGTPIVAKKPEISPGMAQQVADGDRDFFHVYLYDSCAEDGDVVDVVIDGETFATVPITISGATLSVPFGKQATRVQIRGVYDGGGGITVACRTSTGDYFCRDLYEGEVQDLSVVRGK